MSKSLLTSLDQSELASWLEKIGQPSYRASQVLDWIYQKQARSFSEMSNLPEKLRNLLEDDFQLSVLREVRSQHSVDGTRKYLFALEDGQQIETVLIPASPALYGERSDRRTLCVSSQVGCAFDCQFCASGLAGFTRNLQSGEIVSQVLEVEKLSGEKVNNIVFMGMGEPLANFRNLLHAIGTIHAEWGCGIGARRITVSTSGLAPRIRDLADQPLPIRLAISLHGATDQVRDQIMPVNKKYPLAELFEALRYWQEKKKQRITFEYILIDGLNDTPAEAKALAKKARSLNAKVNLIPYNKVEAFPWARPSKTSQEAFLARLDDAGVPATIRLEKGHDIDAACGQLKLRHSEKV